MWYGSLRQHVHVFMNKSCGKEGVCLALLGRLMINIRYAFRAWYVSTCVRACVRACVRDNYLFKINNRSNNCRMHVAGNKSSTTANLEAGDGLSVMAERQGNFFFIVDPIYLNRVQLDIYM